MVTEVKPVQFSKAKEPISVTELGMVIEVKSLHPQKASSPMLLTEFGIVIEAKPLQPEYLQLIVFQFVLLKTVEKWLCGFY